VGGFLGWGSFKLVHSIWARYENSKINEWCPLRLVFISQKLRNSGTDVRCFCQNGSINFRTDIRYAILTKIASQPIYTDIRSLSGPKMIEECLLEHVFIPLSTFWFYIGWDQLSGREGTAQLSVSPIQDKIPQPSIKMFFRQH
jgi:hypothetical protein